MPADLHLDTQLSMRHEWLESACMLQKWSACLNRAVILAGSLFTGGTPTEDALPPTHLGVSQNSGHVKGAAPMGAVPDLFGFYNAQSPATSGEQLMMTDLMSSLVSHCACTLVPGLCPAGCRVMRSLSAYLCSPHFCVFRDM